MSTKLLAVLAASTILAGGVAHAGGFAGAVDAPAVTPAGPVAASGEKTYGGAVTLSFGQLGFYNTDDGFDFEDDDEDEEGQETGVQVLGLNGHVEGTFGRFYGLMDANTVRRDIGDEFFDEYAPSKVTSYGLHVGADLGRVKAGVFVGQNRFESIDGETDEEETNSGNLYGIEAEFESTDGLAVFAQAGRANMEGDTFAEDEGPDTAFEGNFYRIGGSADLGRFGVTVDAETGTSEEVFEDDGDHGNYYAYGLRADYDVTDLITVSAGYERMDIQANTEDEGREETISLGVSFAFGNAAPRPNLTTTYRPGLAAAWAETLD